MAAKVTDINAWRSLNSGRQVKNSISEKNMKAQENFYINLNRYAMYESAKNSDYELAALLKFVPRWKHRRATTRNEDDYISCYIERIKDWESKETSDYFKDYLARIKKVLFNIVMLRDSLKGHIGISDEQSLWIGKLKKTARSMIVDYARQKEGLSELYIYFSAAVGKAA